MATINESLRDESIAHSVWLSRRRAADEQGKRRQHR